MHLGKPQRVEKNKSEKIIISGLEVEIGSI